MIHGMHLHTISNSHRGVFTSLRDKPNQSVTESPQHYLSSLEPWFSQPPPRPGSLSVWRGLWQVALLLTQGILKSCTAPSELSLGLNLVWKWKVPIGYHKQSTFYMTALYLHENLSKSILGSLRTAFDEKVQFTVNTAQLAPHLWGCG